MPGQQKKIRNRACGKKADALNLKLRVTRSKAARLRYVLIYASPIANTAFGLRWGPQKERKLTLFINNLKP